MAKAPRDVGDLLYEELRRRGMSDAEITAATKKKKRRRLLELNAVHVPLHGMRPSVGVSNPDELMTVEAAAGQLKLHPKTILRFIHEGRLKAAKLGKSFRILRSDLDAFAGLKPKPAAEAARVGPATVTSIVDVPGVDHVLAETWRRAIGAAAEGGPVRAEIVHDPARAQFKAVLVGPPGETAGLLKLIKGLAAEE